MAVKNHRDMRTRDVLGRDTTAKTPRLVSGLLLYVGQHAMSLTVAFCAALIAISATLWLLRANAAFALSPFLPWLSALIAMLSVAALYVLGRAANETRLQATRDSAEAHAREERFRLVVEAAPNAMVVVNHHGLIELVNSQAEACFSYTRDELVGKSVEILVPERFRAQPPGSVPTFMNAACRVGAGPELFGLRKDGTEFPIEVGFNPINTDQGTLVLSSIIDISERKAAEQRLMEQADQIAAASRYKSEFLASMSHELRTPLNSILLLAEQLRENRDRNLSSKQVEHANIIHRSGSDLLALINDILDLSKIEAGRMSVSVEKVVASHFAEELRLTFAPLAEERELKFSVVLAPDAPGVVITDRHRMYQVVRNLVSNALKFTEVGMVHVSIFRPQQDIPSDVTVELDQLFAISVTDTGPGIPPDKQQTIFEAFRQLDSSVSRQHGGTGLGLTISRQISKLLGGAVTVTSQMGLGSTFTLYLPIRPVAIAKETEREVRYINPVKVPRSPSPRVLIVEDDPDFAHVLASNAREHNFEPIVVGTGAAALNQTRQTPPDAVILDILLPDINGWDLLAQLRQIPSAATAITYVISCVDKPPADVMVDVREYLVKPVDTAKLTQLFTKLDAELTRGARLLLVADDATTRARLENIFRSDGFQVTPCADFSAAVAAISHISFHTVAIDVAGSDAFEGFITSLAAQADGDMRLIVHTENAGAMLRRHLTDLGAVLLEDGANENAWLEHARVNTPALETLSSTGQHRVLVVDDDVRNTYALCSLFEELHIDVLTAHNGAEALDIARKEKNIDLVFMDISMPVMDGYEATRRLKEDVHFSGPVVALTAYAMKGDREKCLAAGADDYVAKPVNRAELIRILGKWFGQTSAHVESNGHTAANRTRPV